MRSSILGLSFLLNLKDREVISKNSLQKHFERYSPIIKACYLFYFFIYLS